MPIYEYHCKDCEEPFEVFVRSMSNAPAAECPKCKSVHVEKAVSEVAALGGAANLNSAASACAPTG